MPRHASLAASLLLCAALGACGESIGPLPQATVTVDAEPYAYKNGGMVSARMVVTIANRGTVPIYHDGSCNGLLERELSGEWAVVWSPICTLEGRAPLELAPGEAYSFEIRPYGYLDGGWGNPADGRYRVQVFVHGRRRGVPAEMRYSEPFTLTTLLPPAERMPRPAAPSRGGHGS